MATILTPRLSALVKRLFGLKEAPPAESLDSVFPTLPLIDPADPLYSFDRGERRQLWAAPAAAVAAQFGFVRVENQSAAPAPMFVILEQIECSGLAAGALVGVTIEQATGVGAGLNPGQFSSYPLDTRMGPPQLGQVINVRNGSRAAAKASFWQLAADAQGNARFGLSAPFRCVLGPGWSLDVEDQTANAAFKCALVFRTLEIEPSVLT